MSDDERPPDRDHYALDERGRPLPYSPAEVQKIVRAAIENGELLAAVFQKDGDVMVQVFGPPSHELLDVLEAAARGYRHALEGH